MVSNGMEAQVEEIKVGDVVTLRSGGPRMTVGTAHREQGLAVCHWMDGAHPFQGEFPLIVLVRAQTEDERAQGEVDAAGGVPRY